MFKFLLIMMTACGSEVPRFGRVPDQGHELLFLVTEFEHTMRRPIDFPVMMAGDKDFPTADIVGYCFRPEDKRYKPYVMLRTSWWMYASANARWILVFHELGHCALNRDHMDDVDYNDKCAHSVMRSNIGLATLCLDLKSRTREDYKRELFGDQYHDD